MEFFSFQISLVRPLLPLDWLTRKCYLDWILGRDSIGADCKELILQLMGSSWMTITTRSENSGDLVAKMLMELWARQGKTRPVRRQLMECEGGIAMGHNVA